MAEWGGGPVGVILAGGLSRRMGGGDKGLRAFGVGTVLGAVIARARQIGADPLYLLTNRDCAAAIHLYEKLGFRHDAGIMADYGARYARCDVAMRYAL